MTARVSSSRVVAEESSSRGRAASSRISRAADRSLVACTLFRAAAALVVGGAVEHLGRLGQRPTHPDRLSQRRAAAVSTSAVARAIPPPVPGRWWRAARSPAPA